MRRGLPASAVGQRASNASCVVWLTCVCSRAEGEQCFLCCLVYLRLQSGRGRAMLPVLFGLPASAVGERASNASCVVWLTCVCSRAEGEQCFLCCLAYLRLQSGRGQVARLRSPPGSSLRYYT